MRYVETLGPTVTSGDLNTGPTARCRGNYDASKLRTWALSLLLAIMTPSSFALAGEPSGHQHGLHFSHPLVTESPSPDTKIRIDFIATDEPDGNEYTAQLELEYAFARWISFEVTLPYTFARPDAGENHSNLDTVEVALKLASFALEKYGVLLGGGLELGLPTGDDREGIGSNNETEIEPFLFAAWQKGSFEAVTFLTFTIPVHQSKDERDEVDLELGVNISFLYHLGDAITAMLEFDGKTILEGTKEQTVVNITPGIKLRPIRDVPLDIGVGVSVPISHDKKFDVRTLVSAFYHF